MNEKYYTVIKAAQLLNMHPKTIRRYIKEGKLKANKIGKSWLIRGHDLSTFIEGVQPFKRAATAKPGRIKVSAVVDIDVYDMDEAMNIANALTAALNCKPAKYGISTMNVQYIGVESMVRIMLYGNIEFMEVMMNLISAFKKAGDDE